MFPLRSLLDTFPLIVCLASFGWGMRYFFVRPQRLTNGLKLVNTAALASTILNLAAILRLPRIGTTQAAAAVSVFGAALLLFWWAVAFRCGGRCSGWSFGGNPGGETKMTTRSLVSTRAFGS